MSKIVKGAISSASTQICECCRFLKLYAMYVIPMGTSAWICSDCREGKRK